MSGPYHQDERDWAAGVFALLLALAFCGMVAAAVALAFAA